MNLKPAGFYVVVQIEEFEEVTQGGIVIPTQAKQREDNSTDIGTVVAVGPLAYQDRGGMYRTVGDKKIKNWPDVGDKVLFAKHGGVKHDNYRLVNDEDIFGWIEG